MASGQNKMVTAGANADATAGAVNRGQRFNSNLMHPIHVELGTKKIYATSVALWVLKAHPNWPFKILYAVAME
jgi:hypothetical protein